MCAIATLDDGGKSPAHQSVRSFRLGALRYWVWQVLQVFDPGSRLPAPCMGNRSSSTAVYECHLYCPKVGNDMSQQMLPVWDNVNKHMLLLTLPEKAATRHRKMKKRGRSILRLRNKEKQSVRDPSEKLRCPMTAFLRPANVIGGGFLLTGTKRVPKHVPSYVLDDLPLT